MCTHKIPASTPLLIRAESGGESGIRRGMRAPPHTRCCVGCVCLSVCAMFVAAQKVQLTSKHTHTSTAIMPAAPTYSFTFFIISLSFLLLRWGVLRWPMMLENSALDLCVCAIPLALYLELAIWYVALLFLSRLPAVLRLLGQFIITAGLFKALVVVKGTLF